MSARLVLEDRPGAFIAFDSGGRDYRARMDPMWLGAEKFLELLERPRLVWKLLDKRSAGLAMTSDPFGTRVVSLLVDYLDAVGLGVEGFAELVHALGELDALEVDLLRVGLDVRDWLDPEGSLSSRRVCLLVRDFNDRPETRLGAKRFDVLPLAKGEILLAQYVGGPKKGESHQFLKSPSELEAEHKARIEDAKKRERIKQRGF